jgi:hypothetical protein
VDVGGAAGHETICLAQTPGEDAICEVPGYPRHIEVLQDSWSYRQPIPESDANRETTWYNTGGECGNSVIAVCAADQLLYLRQIVTPSTGYSGRRVLVNITYHFENCVGTRCVGSTIELLLVTYKEHNQPYLDRGAIMPTNEIVLTHHSSTTSVTETFHFDLEKTESVFAFAMKSLNMTKCFMATRVIIYLVQKKIHTVDESYAKVCFISTGGGAEAVIRTQDGTAVGNFDYDPVTEVVVFERGQSHCVMIEIFSDGLAEGEEDFTVVLLLGSIVKSSTTVIIARNGIGVSSCAEGTITTVSDVHSSSSLRLVQMCSTEGVWFPLCDNNWTRQDASVVCRGLGFTNLGMYGTLQNSTHVAFPHLL